MTYQEQKMQILNQLDEDFHYYHDGKWDYNGPKPFEKASLALDELVKKWVIGEKIANWTDVGSKVGFKNIPMTHHNASKFRTGWNSHINEQRQVLEEGKK